MKKFTKPFKSGFKYVCTGALTAVFCAGLVFSPQMAQANDDGERTWRKGHCFLDKKEEFCRRKKSGPACGGADYCNLGTYLKTAVTVAKIVEVVDKNL